MDCLLEDNNLHFSFFGIFHPFSSKKVKIGFSVDIDELISNNICAPFDNFGFSFSPYNFFSYFSFDDDK